MARAEPSTSGPLIGIVANEPSGDQLGALLIGALRALRPDLRFVGVAGPKMLAQGCASLLPMERLSVMGLVEVVKVLPQLLRARRELVTGLRGLRPNVVIGVDAPDFNLGLERRLRASGVPTVHLVSPTVWAWRPGRVKQIRRSIDLMLSIFPFEADFLKAHRVPVEYIGHPLADTFPLEPDRASALRALGLSSGPPPEPSASPGEKGASPGQTSGPSSGPTSAPSSALVAVLPGSRRGEIELLGPSMLETVAWCHARRPGLQFVAPMVSAGLAQRFEAMRLEIVPEAPLRIVEGHSREAMAAADLVLTASGTATLEALLSKRPMLVAYRLHPLTYWLVTQLRLIKVRYAAMANLLVGRELAPEFIQERCCAEQMGPALLALLDDSARRDEIERAYHGVHLELRRNAARRAAEAILSLVDQRVANANANASANASA
jgi:lipid-A-disaccharide synthase